VDGADSAQSPAGSQGQANRTEAYLELPPPRTRPELAAFIARAAIDGARNRRTFREVERFFFMLGYTRSGSTLVGSLLNAHPEMVIAQEIDIFRFLRPGITRNTLYGMVLVRDRQFAAIDRDYHGFDYAVPEGDQGRFTRLRVLGDKHAGRATRRLRDDPQALERLRSLVGVPIRVLHLVRNPFDNIASIARNREMPLSSAIAIYRKLGIAVDQIGTRLGADEFFEVRYEDLLANPTARLDDICQFIGVPAATDYLQRCATLIDHGGRRSRDSLSWSPEEIRMVEELIASRPSLEHYSFVE
jgi:Sulfotransferase family